MVTYYPESEFNEILKQGCGTGEKSCAMGPTGKIRPCVLLPEEYVVFGDLRGSSVRDVFNNPLADRFRRIRQPLKQECDPCRFAYTCQPCIARGMMIGRRLNGGCKWIHENGIADMCLISRTEI